MKPPMEPFFNPELWEDFKAHRRELKKPLRATSERYSMNKLYKLSNGNAPMAEAIISQTIERGWLGFFPLQKETLEAFRRSEQDRIVNAKKPCEYCGKPITETGRFRHEDNECPNYKKAPVNEVLSLVNNFRLAK
jgi:hypothetical protein